MAWEGGIIFSSRAFEKPSSCRLLNLQKSLQHLLKTRMVWIYLDMSDDLEMDLVDLMDLMDLGRARAPGHMSGRSASWSGGGTRAGIHRVRSPDANCQRCHFVEIVVFLWFLCPCPHMSTNLCHILLIISYHLTSKLFNAFDRFKHGLRQNLMLCNFTLFQCSSLKEWLSYSFIHVDCSMTESWPKMQLRIGIMQL